MSILGIDPGSHRTGWGLVRSEGSKLRYVAAGVVHAVGEDLSGRLLQIAGGLDDVLAEHRPSAVAIEDVFHHKNSQSALRLGQARGVALLSVARAGVPVYEYAPADIKRAVVGNGRADKETVLRMVRLHLGLQGALADALAGLSVDASDALAAAICHASRSPLRAVAL